jgi:hypothetical protein
MQSPFQPRSTRLCRVSFTALKNAHEPFKKNSAHNENTNSIPPQEV